MKKLFLASLIVSLIIFTTLVKNSTKKVDDEIYHIKEKISFLNTKYETIKLEYDYITSPEKIFEYYNLYFEEDFDFKESTSLGIIYVNDLNLIYKNFKKINE